MNRNTIALLLRLPVASHAEEFTGTVVGVTDGDMIKVHRERVRSGLAWWYKKYSTNKTRERLEAEGLEAKWGLWADPKPVAPWDWRKQKRAAEADAAEVEPAGVEIGALLPDPAHRDEGHEEIKIGNSTDRLVIPDDWKVPDRAGHDFRLGGESPPGSQCRRRGPKPGVNYADDQVRRGE
jgi:hypothetical protein